MKLELADKEILRMQEAAKLMKSQNVLQDEMRSLEQKNEAMNKQNLDLVKQIETNRVEREKLLLQIDQKDVQVADLELIIKELRQKIQMH